MLAAAAALIVGASLAAGLGIAAADEATQAGRAPAGLPGLGGPFALIDQDGHSRTDAEFRGKLLLVTFGYTDCPDICPLELQKVSDALALAGPAVAADVVPLFITIDPVHDTPGRLKRFVHQFGDNIIGLIGAPDSVGQVAHAYRVHAHSTGHDDHQLIDHSDFQYLMGRDGSLLSLIVPNATAADISKRLQKYAADGQD
jgi:cytochrome oxidase Cu insertion factor (SCO1/SenC/PrrC family)